jgi:hypothetical protein
MKNRLFTSRKIWGGIIGSVFIFLIALFAVPEHVISIVGTLGIMWGLVIGGQAVGDSIEKHKQRKEDNNEPPNP